MDDGNFIVWICLGLTCIFTPLGILLFIAQLRKVMAAFKEGGRL